MGSFVHIFIFTGSSDKKVLYISLEHIIMYAYTMSKAKYNHSYRIG